MSEGPLFIVAAWVSHLHVLHHLHVSQLTPVVDCALFEYDDIRHINFTLLRESC